MKLKSYRISYVQRKCTFKQILEIFPNDRVRIETMSYTMYACPTVEFC